MKTPLPLLAGILALTLHFAGPLRSADQPIDVERARELFRRAQAGETLTADEQKYLEEAKRRRDAQDGGASPDREKTRAIREKMDRGEKLTEEDKNGRPLKATAARTSGNRWELRQLPTTAPHI